MSTGREPGVSRQAARRARRKRSRADRERRDAAFTQKSRGRPKGTGLAFFDDRDRFAIAIVHCAHVFRCVSLYHAAYIAVALTSDVPLETASLDYVREALGRPDLHRYIQFSGGPAHATLKGAADALVVKLKAPRSRDEAEWIKWSAGYLDSLVDMYLSPRPVFDASWHRVIFDLLTERGWAGALQEIAQKLSLAARSNFPPAERSPSRRTIELLWPKPKS